MSEIGRLIFLAQPSAATKCLTGMVNSPELVGNKDAFEKFIEAMVANPQAQSLQGFLRQAEAVLGNAAAVDTRVIAHPTLVLAGRHDLLTRLYFSEQLAAQLPSAQLSLLTSRHSAFVEYPADYSRAIAAFLKSEKADNP